MMPLVTIPDNVFSIIVVGLILGICTVAYIAYCMGLEQNFPDDRWELGPSIPPSLGSPTVTREDDVILVRVPRTEVNAYLAEATDKDEPLVLEFPIECLEEESYGGADRD